MTAISLSKKQRIFLALILGVTCFLRFYKLGFQSFWLDELHTAIEADPSMSWKDMFVYLKCCDQHPPLFFFAEKILFLIFGNTEFVARALSAIAGTASVWAIYLLGREFYSVKLGLVAATLTCFNYFHIWHSQEARPYAFLFLFACLSFLYLVRLIKDPNRKNSIWYSVFTLLMIGSHYFGLFAFVSQMVIATLFWILEKENRKLFFKHFAISGVIIAICFSPWIPFLRSMVSIKSFWIQPVSQSFAIDFFYEYFGNSDLLKPFLLLFLISALVHFFMRSDIQNTGIKKNVFSFSFLICFLWIGISYFIPYLRSIMVVPMLFPRYTIVLLPAFIIILSFGIELISNSIIKYSLLVFFCILSLTDLFLVKKQYSEVHKTQFREMANFIASDTNFVYPVISEVTAWHQQYYLKRFGYKAKIIEGKKEAMIDSILNKTSSKYALEGFWLSDAHDGQKPTEELTKKINSSFILIKEQDFNDSWAQLYISRNAPNKNWAVMDYHAFSTEKPFELNRDSVLAIWDNQVIADPFTIKKGRYIVNVMLNGTPSAGVFPHINFFINDKLINSFYATEGFEYHTFSFETAEDISAVIKLKMDNDAFNPEKKEDRNAFVKSISFLKVGE